MTAVPRGHPGFSCEHSGSHCRNAQNGIIWIPLLSMPVTRSLRGIRRYVRFDSFEDCLFVALRCPGGMAGEAGISKGSGRLPEFLASFQEHLLGALPRSCCEPDGPIPERVGRRFCPGLGVPRAR